MRPVGAIIVPAHNEAAVITRCLDALGPACGRATVVVACNGCTDATARLAREHPARPLVIEIQQASKTAALRAAEAALPDHVHPRLFVDADVVVTSETAELALHHLGSPDALAGRPDYVYDVGGAAAVVRMYFRARRRLPITHSALWGAGVYGLSREGRSRFGEFPDVVADDLFVDSMFLAHEKVITPGPPVVVRTPRTTRGLLRVLSRQYRGNAQLTGTAVAGTRVAAPAATAAALAGSWRQQDDVPAVLALADACVYMALATTGRVAGRLRRERWARDESSRASVRGRQ